LQLKLSRLIFLKAIRDLIEFDVPNLDLGGFGRDNEIGTSRGCGQVQVELSSPCASLPLGERAARFERALGASLAALGIDPGLASEVVPITLWAPLIPDQSGGDGAHELAEKLGGVDQWLLSVRRFVAEGGFDQLQGAATAARAIAAGSVFVARLAGGWRGRLEQLAELEREGAGTRRHQGYGQLLCFDPLSAGIPIGESRP